MPEEEKKEEAAADAPATEAPAPKEPETPAEAPKEEAKTEVEVPAKFKKIVSDIEEMSVMELNELVKVFENKFGVSAAAVAVAGPAANGDGADEGPSTVNVKLTSSGEQKIAVIKVVRTALALGLAEAKKLVDDAPTVLKEGMKKEEADALKKEIETAGGTVEYA